MKMKMKKSFLFLVITLMVIIGVVIYFNISDQGKDKYKGILVQECMKI